MRPAGDFFFIQLSNTREHCGNHTEKAVIPKGLFYIFLFVLFGDPECIQ